MRVTPPHDHADIARLTIGCPGCIELVRLDQIICVFIDWFQTCEDDWEESDEPMPERPPTPSRWRAVYGSLRGLGYEPYDIRYPMMLWAQEHGWGPAASAKADSKFHNGGLLPA